jgi:hypothetical protein
MEGVCRPPAKALLCASKAAAIARTKGRAGRHLDMGAMALNEAVGLHLVEAR